MKSRDFKDYIYGQFARISKALSSPKRFELLDYLSHGPKTVERLSNEAGMSTANTSKHLQALLEARLVSFRKDKNYVYYALAHPDLVELLKWIKKVSEIQFGDIEQIREEHVGKHSEIKVVHLGEIMQELEAGEAILIDVRPEDEFNDEHIPGAVSLPVHLITERFISLPKDKKIVAYCRGPYCVYATEAVAMLNSYGYEACRLEEGIHEWRASVGVH